MPAFAEAKVDPLVGSVIDEKYRLDARIGEGATGVVYEAHAIADGKRVAVKVLHRELHARLSFVCRFHVEAKAASLIEHPNTARIYDFGLDPTRNHLYICMEYLEGRPLAAMLTPDRPLPKARVVDIMLQTLAALGAAHLVGLLHRDLRPEHILVDERTDDNGQRRDVVKVCDFGIGKLRAADLSIAIVDPSSGTPEYMSPEQARGRSLDPRSDLYAAGVILYQMLTGRLPFEAESVSEILERQVHEDPRPPSSFTPNVDAQLEAICLKALNKSPRDRYASSREMRAALRSTSTAMLTAARRGDTPGLTSSSDLNVSTPFMPLPISEITAMLELEEEEHVKARRPPPQPPPSLALVLTDLAPTAPPPPLSAPEILVEGYRPVTVSGVHSRRAPTVVSQQRLAEVANEETSRVRESRRGWLVPLVGGLVVGAIVATVAWQQAGDGHLSTADHSPPAARATSTR